MNIYVGNLAYDVTEDELRTEFSSFGKVELVSIPKDKFSGQPRGFAFVEMPSVSEGQAAISALNGKIIKDRTLSVSAARPRSESRSNSYSGDKGGRFGGGRQRR